MRILVAHNYYQQPGGEDVVFAAETELLRRHGHEVIEYTVSNDSIYSMNTGAAALNALWSCSTKKKIIELIDRAGPDIAHFHNTFLLISPSAYYACRERNVPVVQSLHNPRLLCPAGSFYRDGGVCEDCMGKTPPWPGVLHGCYRGSRSQTALVAAMLTMHRMLKTWDRVIDTFIVFTEFYKRKFIEGGLPAEKIALKPHFVDPDPGCRNGQKGEYALYIGRLDRVKGISTMLRAWRRNKNIPLKIRGDGRLLGEVADYINQHRLRSVEIVGRLDRNDLNELIKNARFLVWPSEGYYETFGLVAIEAFACGVPVIASRTGTLAENVTDGHTGLHFTPGNAEDLSAKVNWAWSHPEEMSRMGRTARREYETNYSSEKNYRMLLGIYQKAINAKKSRN
jgi:glycosyltransferase involved in cell wall biosynthesis